MKLRKHIRADVLHKIYDEVQLGVPVARSMRSHLPSDSMTRPTVVNLLETLAELKNTVDTTDADILASSLFPPWLDEHGEVIQEQPHNYDYTGCFPIGRWQCGT